MPGPPDPRELKRLRAIYFSNRNRNSMKIIGGANTGTTFQRVDIPLDISFLRFLVEDYSQSTGDIISTESNEPIRFPRKKKGISYDAIGSTFIVSVNSPPVDQLIEEKVIPIQQKLLPIFIEEEDTGY